MNPRVAQIFSLLFLLGTGAVLRDFSIQSSQIVLTFLAGLSTQWFFLKRLNLDYSKHSSFLSPVITCFGISLLLRSHLLWVHPCVASLAIAAKFLVRFKGKHLFNPANLGVMIAVLILPGSWVSAGQWGSDLAFAFLFLALGLFVVSKANTMGSAWMFLVAYMSIWALYRVGYLGYEWAVWKHQLSSGALLLFSFFMISDPKTSPNNSHARVLHVVCVAVLAHLFSYYFYIPNGILLALLVASPLVVLLDYYIAADRYEWRDEIKPIAIPQKRNEDTVIENIKATATHPRFGLGDSPASFSH